MKLRHEKDYMVYLRAVQLYLELTYDLSSPGGGGSGPFHV